MGARDRAVLRGDPFDGADGCGPFEQRGARGGRAAGPARPLRPLARRRHDRTARPTCRNRIRRRALRHPRPDGSQRRPAGQAAVPRHAHARLASRAVSAWPRRSRSSTAACPRTLAASGYNERRTRMRAAARALVVGSLRDAIDIQAIESLPPATAPARAARVHREPAGARGGGGHRRAGISAS